MGSLFPLPDRAQRARAEPPRAHTTRTPPAAPCASIEGAESEALWDEFEALDERKHTLEASLSELIGERQGFEPIAPSLRPDLVEETVAAALGEDDGTIEWIDCSEAPCIAIVRLPPERWQDESFVDIGDDLRDAVGASYSWEAFGARDGQFITVPLGRRPDDPSLQQRVDLREELIIAEIASR